MSVANIYSSGDVVGWDFLPLKNVFSLSFKPGKAKQVAPTNEWAEVTCLFWD